MEPQNDNSQPESTPHFDEFSGKANSSSSFDMNQTPKPEPLTTTESQADVINTPPTLTDNQVVSNNNTVPLGDGPMTSFAPKPSISEEASRIPEATPSEQAPQGLIVSKSKWYKSKKFIISIVVAIIVVALAGGSVFAYTWYQNPQKVISDSMINALTAKTILFTGNIDVSNKDVKATINISGGSADATGKFDATLKITTNGKTYSGNGGVIYDNQGNLYFKIGGLAAMATELKNSVGVSPTAPAAVALDKLVAKIDNQWIKVSSDDLKAYSEGFADTNKCLNDTMKKYKNDKTAIKEFVDLYDKNEFVIAEKELGQKDGNLGYQIKVDNSKVKTFIEGAKQTKVYKSLHDCDSGFVIDTSDMSNSGNADIGTVKIWSNMWTHQLAKLEATQTDENGTKATMLLDTKFNENVTVKAPDSSISLTQLQSYIQELYTGVYGGTTTNSSTIDITTQI